MSSDSQALDQHFLRAQARLHHAVSQPHPLRGSTFARLFIPFIGSVTDEQPLDNHSELTQPTYLRRRIARASGEDSIRLRIYLGRLGEYMRRHLETSV